MRVLVTSARAPVALEWCRIAKRSGHEVWSCDSVEISLTQEISTYYRHMAPNQDQDLYAKQMAKLIEQVDLVIPTCEDIFHLTGFLPDHLLQKVFAPPHDLLVTLHHKLDFLKLVEPTDQFPHEVLCPATELLTGGGQAPDLTNKILKPVYSRFGTEVIMDPKPEDLAKINPTVERPWVAQEKLTSTRPGVCAYAVFDSGQLVDWSCYRAAAIGSGKVSTAFVMHYDDRIRKFLETLGRRHQFSGQISFDFIEVEDDIYVIECNPRATSGLHILADRLFIDEQGCIKSRPGGDHRQGHLGPITWARAMTGGLDQIKEALAVTISGRSVLHDLSLKKQIRFLKQMKDGAKLTNSTLEAYSTMDFQWDGSLGNQSPALMDNGRIDTHELDDLDLFVTTNNQPGNSWTFSPATMLGPTALHELAEFDKLTKFSTALLLNFFKAMAGSAALDQVAGVNNLGFTTLLHPKRIKELDPLRLGQVLTLKLPSHAHTLRSLTYRWDEGLINRYQSAGWLPIVTRSAWLIDDPKEVMSLRPNKKDLRLLSPDRVVIERLTGNHPDSAFDAVAGLYNQLYLEKYSDTNPRFEPEALKRLVEDEVLDVYVMQDSYGEPRAMVGMYRVDDTVTPTMVGYDLKRPQSEGWYRATWAFSLRYAAERGLKLHYSAGAGEFKRRRGAQQSLEVMMINTKHLGLFRRLVWKSLSALTLKVYGPLLKQKGL